MVECVDKQHISCARQVIDIESKAIANLINSVDENFSNICNLLLQCKGRIIVTGMGKSGHIGKKMAATFASTGSPAFFVHPAEALHGDLGMITPKDIIIILSYSGKSPEITSLLPSLKCLGVKTIIITGNTNSINALNCDFKIKIKVEKEACNLGLAPTSSTTATLVLGDALAICLATSRGFKKEHFALSHPGGNLGKRLVTKVKDIMRVGSHIPKVLQQDNLKDALLEISSKQLGMTAIVEAENSDKLLGIFTDGDLRRCINKGYDINNTKIKEIMTTSFKSVTPESLAINALDKMEKFKILSLVVVDNDSKLVGAFNMHDLFSAGII